MARIIINNKAVSADTGENLLDLAKLQPAHIGFVCGGNGLCGTCEIKVLQGAENLTKPTRVEREWLNAQRIEEGYRLACQTMVKGEGTVQILTRAEEVRQEFTAIFNPPKGKNPLTAAGDFISDVANPNQLAQFANGVISSTGRVGIRKMLFPWNKPLQFLQDTGRVIQAQITPPVAAPKSKPVKVNTSTKIAIEKAPAKPADEGTQLIEQLSDELEQKFVSLANPATSPADIPPATITINNEGEEAFSEIQAEVASKLEGIYADAEADKAKEDEKKPGRFRIGFRKK
jgi:ferredoxin